MTLVDLEPIDHYTIKRSHPITEEDRHVVYSLYQPLVGIESISLYMMMLTEQERKSDQIQNHYFYMNVFGESITTIQEWRMRLEAIGLMNSYVEQKEIPLYHYELMPPVSAKSFFEDPLLSTFLFSKVGEATYIRLRDLFVIPKWKTDALRNVTRSFTDLFEPTSMRTLPPMEENHQFETSRERGPSYRLPAFDFQALRNHLSEQLMDDAQFERLPKALIQNLAHLYQYTPFDMYEILLIAMNQSGGQLTEQTIRKTAIDFYKLNRSTEPPALRKKAYDSPSSQEVGEVRDEKNDMIRYFNTVSPAQMLCDISQKQPYPTTLKLIERLMNEHSMPTPVINVLLHYIYLNYNGKITASLTETIAQQWAMKGIQTAEEAIAISKLEHTKYQKYKEDKERKPERQNTYTKRTTREEPVPEWFGKEQEEQREETSEEVERLRQALIEELGIPQKEGDDDGTDQS